MGDGNLLGGGRACTYGIYGLVGSDVSTYYGSLVVGVRMSMSVGGDGTILLVNIVSRMPNDFKNLFDMFANGKDIVHMIFTIAIIAAIVILTTVLVVLLQDAERRIPVSYAQKVQGRRSVGGRSSYIPLKVNTGGVMPIIFASTLLSIPTIVTNLFNVEVKSTFWAKFLQGLSSNYWFRPGYPHAYFGLLFYILLVSVICGLIGCFGFALAKLCGSRFIALIVPECIIGVLHLVDKYYFDNFEMEKGVSLINLSKNAASMMINIKTEYGIEVPTDDVSDAICIGLAGVKIINTKGEKDKLQ